MYMYTHVDYVSGELTHPDSISKFTGAKILMSTNSPEILFCQHSDDVLMGHLLVMLS